MSWWFLYDMIDPRDAKVFYVGCTSAPEQRYLCHLRDPASIVYWRFRNVAVVPKMAIIDAFLSKTEALAAETKRIRETPTAENPSRKYIWAQMTDTEREAKRSEAVKRHRGKP